MRQVRAAGIRLAYETWGGPGAPPMVLLHSLGARGTDWAPVAGQFAERYRVLAFDLRGHGGSDWPGAYSTRLMCGDVLAALDVLGLGPVTLAGHSLGGVVAYQMAMRQPDRIGRLIVEDAAPPWGRDRPVPARPEMVDFDWAVVPAIVREINTRDPEAWAGLPSITAPSLVVGGGPESSVPQEMLAEAAALIPSCKLVTIPAGHHVHTTEPGRFAAAVLDWLGG